MALQDKAKEQMDMEDQDDQSPKGNLSDEEETDLEIAVLIGERLLDDGGMEVIQKAIDQSRDPAQVIGQFFIQMIQQLMESLPEDVQLSPRVFLAKGGFVEQLMDYLDDEMEIDTKILDKAEIYIATTITQMGNANAAKQQQTAGPAPAGQPAVPAMPQGAPQQ